MDKWVLLTGASSGIGRITALYLAEQGYKLALLARSEDKLATLSQEMKEASVLLPFDLTALDQIGEVFETCREQGIKLDGLVHCAGMGINTPVRGNNIEEMKSTMTVNYFSFVEMGKSFGLRK